MSEFMRIASIVAEVPSGVGPEPQPGFLGACMFLAGLVVAHTDPVRADELRTTILEELARAMGIPAEVLERQLQERYGPGGTER